MIDRSIKSNVLQNIPEVGLIGAFEDEVINYDIVKDDIKFSTIAVNLKYLTGIKLRGGLMWSNILDNKDITYIKKLLEESTEEIKSLKKEFKASNGMNCTIKLTFNMDGTILDAIEDRNRFVLKFIDIDFVSPGGTKKILTDKDVSILKEHIEQLKIDLDRKCELLVNELNSYAGEKKIFDVIRVPN